MITSFRRTSKASQYCLFSRKNGSILLAQTAASGIFCWWSYVSPWLQKTGGWSATMVPMLMVLAGLGMVVGGIVGGRLTDLWKAGATAALSHGIALCGLLLVFLLPGNHATTALLTFIIGFALFFNSSPQQLLMVQAGEGGGELIAGAAVQIAFNFGNAIGSIVGGAALTATAMNYHFTDRKSVV